MDAETGKTIPYAGAGFKLYRPDGTPITQSFTYPEVTVIDTFYTNDKGYLITPESLEYGMGYYLVEVTAPHGYVLNSDPMYFDITADSAKDENGIAVNMLKANHLNQKYTLEDLVLRKYPSTIVSLTERIAGLEKDIELAESHPKPLEGFVGMMVLDTHYTEKEDAGKAIIDVCTRMQDSETVSVGEYRGFALSITYDGITTQYLMTLKGSLSHTFSLGADVFGNITRMDNAIDGLSTRLEAVRDELENTKVQLERARTDMNEPFPKEAELAEKTARLKTLNILLNMDQKDKEILDDAPEGEVVEKEKVKPQAR